MPVQFPTFSIAEQTDRSDSYARNTLFPYSYQFNVTNNALNWNRTQTYSSGEVFSYFTIALKADNNMAISALDINAATRIALGVAPLTSTQIIEISYVNTLDPGILIADGTPLVPPTIPSDIGNIIYRNVLISNIPTAAASLNSGTVTVQEYRRYEPYNYILKFNQIVYMHFALDVFTIAAGAALNGGVIFHMLPTGAKT